MIEALIALCLVGTSLLGLHTVQDRMSAMGNQSEWRGLGSAVVLQQLIRLKELTVDAAGPVPATTTATMEVVRPDQLMRRLITTAMSEPVIHSEFLMLSSVEGRWQDVPDRKPDDRIVYRALTRIGLTPWLDEVMAVTEPVKTETPMHVELTLKTQPILQATGTSSSRSFRRLDSAWALSTESSTTEQQVCRILDAQVSSSSCLIPVAYLGGFLVVDATYLGKLRDSGISLDRWVDTLRVSTGTMSTTPSGSTISCLFSTSLPATSTESADRYIPYLCVISGSTPETVRWSGQPAFHAPETSPAGALCRYEPLDRGQTDAAGQASAASTAGSQWNQNYRIIPIAEPLQTLCIGSGLSPFAAPARLVWVQSWGTSRQL